MRDSHAAGCVEVASADLERMICWLATLQPAFPPPPSRRHSDHLGAMLADTALQAGVNYGYVVFPRVRRIEVEFREAATLRGLTTTLAETPASVLLQWRHPVKLQRFADLFNVITVNGLQTVEEVGRWLSLPHANATLLAITGVGPKTVDYLHRLCGRPVWPIDRHFRRLLSWAGVSRADYAYSQTLLQESCRVLGFNSEETEHQLWVMLRAIAR